MKQKVPQTVGECFELIEKSMFQGPYVMGADYTICDMYLFTICQWLEGDGVDIKRFPKVAEHWARMSEDPIVKKVVAEEQVSR
jgi:glutathione S-transferase